MEVTKSSRNGKSSIKPSSVEVDDSSHDEERDAARDEITEEAGIKTYRYRAIALPTHEEIMEIMK